MTEQIDSDVVTDRRELDAVLDSERTRIASQVLALVFSLRPDDGPLGQAWLYTLLTDGLARTMLITLGPDGDPEELIASVMGQVRELVRRTQSEFFKAQLEDVRMPPRGKRH